MAAPTRTEGSSADLTWSVWKGVQLGESIDPIRVDAADAIAEGDMPHASRGIVSRQVTAAPPPLVVYVERRIADVDDLLEEGEVPPSGEAKSACLAHLARVSAVWLRRSDVPLPFCGSSGGGEIFCEWRRSGRRIFLMVSPRGRISLFWALTEGTHVVTAHTLDDPSHHETRIWIDWVLEDAS